MTATAGSSVHHSNPSSIDHHHQSMPSSPLNEVMASAANSDHEECHHRRGSVASSSSAAYFESVTPAEEPLTVSSQEEDKSKELLSDLESVLSEAAAVTTAGPEDDDVGDGFPFPSALSSDEGGTGLHHLKTPEKLLHHSIPPSSMMVPKVIFLLYCKFNRYVKTFHGIRNRQQPRHQLLPELQLSLLSRILRPRTLFPRTTS